MLDQINNTKKVVIRSITTYEELLVLMPLFMKGYEAMVKRSRFERTSKDAFVKTLLGVLGSQDRNGIMVAFDGLSPVGYGVAIDSTDEFDEHKSLLLWSLYILPRSGKGVTKSLFGAAQDWAKEKGYKYLDACNSRFTGSAYKFFEEGFGMRRAYVTFTKEI